VGVGPRQRQRRATGRSLRARCETAGSITIFTLQRAHARARAQQQHQQQKPRRSTPRTERLPREARLQPPSAWRPHPPHPQQHPGKRPASGGNSRWSTPGTAPCARRQGGCPWAPQGSASPSGCARCCCAALARRGQRTCSPCPYALPASRRASPRRRWLRARHPTARSPTAQVWPSMEGVVGRPCTARTRSRAHRTPLKRDYSVTGRRLCTALSPVNNPKVYSVSGSSRGM